MDTSFNVKSSVGWCLACIIVSIWQGAMRRYNALLQRIVTQQKIENSVLKHHRVPHRKGTCHSEKYASSSHEMTYYCSGQLSILGLIIFFNPLEYTGVTANGQCLKKTLNSMHDAATSSKRQLHLLVKLIQAISQKAKKIGMAARSIHPGNESGFDQ